MSGLMRHLYGAAGRLVAGQSKLLYISPTIPIHPSLNCQINPALNLISVMPLHTSPPLELQITPVLERARQSTRIRKRKVYLDNKKKKEERLRKNPPPIPKKVQLMLKSLGFGPDPLEWRPEDNRPFATDDVWSERWFTYNRMSVTEALNCLREHYHPTMLNDPDGIVYAKIELDMTGAKKDRYMEEFSKMIPLYNSFERGVTEKSILVFAKSTEAQKEAMDAGAQRTGGLELIDDIAKGKLEILDFDHFLAHEDIVLELKPLLGILRENFPKKPNGTVGTNMEKLVKTFSNGQIVEVKKPKSTLGYKDDPAYGYCEAMIGRLGMPDSAIESNLETIMSNLKESAPTKRANEFIFKVQLYLDGPLKGKFSVSHDLIHDEKLKSHLAAVQSS
eukprot:TRINITY_DN24938_c0_g1_i1.p1 TRINITY_DN24938_c0_g1~~TRINITY_DN24938_c0_g1_i1.p1  ORF type:complete len:401 (-),score=59.12 TRINITY_DN24938_c0_g1_i1:32-1204(-)